MSKRILVGISGGMDSAVTAALLKTQGFDVIGLHVQVWNPSDPNQKRPGGSCMRQTTTKEIERLCKQLDIQCHFVNAADEYQNAVVDDFVHETLVGRVPNPCVNCVGKVKIATLLKKADQLHCDLVATGHYAKVVKNSDGTEANIYRPVDRSRDQTYFLFDLTQSQLLRMLMPLGDLLEANVQKMAITFGLPLEQKPKYQRICFVEDDSYHQLVESHCPERYRPGGLIVSREGATIGRHYGLFHYRLGMKGKGVEKPEFVDKPVVGFDIKMNAIIVGEARDLYRTGLVAVNCNWIGVQDFSRGMKVKAKIRSHHHQEADCIVTLLNSNSALVDFKEPQAIITAGQPIVFYQEDILVGGGWIESLTDPVVTKLNKRSAFLSG